MDHYLEKSLMTGWAFLTGDVNYKDYGGKWYRQVGDGLYHVIELINMVDAFGDDVDFTYMVTLQEIDVESQNVREIMDQYGITPADTDDMDADAITCIILDAGRYIPLLDVSGGNYRLLLRHAKQESRRIASDHNLHLSLLQRPVNAIGSTALEYSQGDFKSAMIRGIAKGDSTARLLGRIHGATNDDMDAVESDAADFSMVHPCEYRDIIDRVG